MTVRDRLDEWVVPAPVLRLAVPVTGGLAVPLVVAWLVSGPAAALAVTLGFSGALIPAFMLRGRWAATMCVPLAMAGAVGVAVNGQPFPAACFAALCCLLVAPANTIANGLLAGLPTVVAVAVATPTTIDPVLLFGWMLVSGLLVVLIAQALPRPGPSPGIPARSAWVHAGTMAAAVGATVFFVTWQELPRGFWVPMTMTIVLRPLADETRRLSRQRVTGTVVGAVVAVTIAAVLPRWAALAVGLVLLVALVSYGLLDRYEQQVAMLTPLLIVLGTGGVIATIGVAAERILATTIGVALAALLALGLARWAALGPPEPVPGLDADD
jgi:hypothetical protein